MPLQCAGNDHEQEGLTLSLPNTHEGQKIKMEAEVQPRAGRGVRAGGRWMFPTISLELYPGDEAHSPGSSRRPHGTVEGSKLNFCHL